MTAVAVEGMAPRRRLSAESRRRQLIDVALETFAQSGYEATTMEDIATAAGVTKPLLYQHFTSKRSLYLELIDDVTSRLLEALASATAAEPNWHRRVEVGMTAYFRFLWHNESAVRMLFGVPPEEELARGLRRIEDAIAGFVAPLIEADIDESHRHTVAAAVVGMTEGVTRDWLRNRERLGAPVISEESENEVLHLGLRLAEFAWGGLRSLHRD